MSFLSKVKSFVTNKSYVVGSVFALSAVVAAIRSVAMLAQDQGFMAWFKTMSVPGYVALALMFFFKWDVVKKLSK